MQITENMQQSLRSATSWMKFLAILGSIGAGLMILSGLLALIGATQAHYGKGSAMMLAFTYIGVGCVYAYMVAKAFGFIKNARNAMMTDDETLMEDAFSDFHSLVKCMGIMAIVGIALFIILIAIVISSAAHTSYYY